MTDEHPLVALARSTIEAYVRHHRMTLVPDAPSVEMSRRAGTFVSLHRNGQLRGCIGTIAPMQASVAAEVISNAISAAVRDPRFLPVTPAELGNLEISVDVLEEPEPISSIDQLDVKEYGVIVERGMRRGLLLPNLEGIDTPQEQVAIALSKAGIGPDERYSMQRFRVTRYH
jgi:AmmeMemoRadiSam system protein A